LPFDFVTFYNTFSHQQVQASQTSDGAEDQEAVFKNIFITGISINDLFHFSLQ